VVNIRILVGTCHKFHYKQKLINKQVSLNSTGYCNERKASPILSILYLPNRCSLIEEFFRQLASDKSLQCRSTSVRYNKGNLKSHLEAMWNRPNDPEQCLRGPIIRKNYAM